MAFELNDKGNITCFPLFEWEMRLFLDSGCLIRLVLATSADRPDKNQKSVQLSMSAEQLESFVQDLQKAATFLRETSQKHSTH